MTAAGSMRHNQCVIAQNTLENFAFSCTRPSITQTAPFPMLRKTARIKHDQQMGTFAQDVAQ